MNSRTLHLRQRFSWLVVEYATIAEIVDILSLKKISIKFWNSGYHIGTRDNNLFAISISPDTILICGSILQGNAESCWGLLADELRKLSLTFGKVTWFSNQYYVGSHALVGQYGWALCEKGILKRHYVYEFTSSNIYADIGELLPIERTIQHRLQEQGLSTVGYGTLQTEDITANADIVFEIAQNLNTFDLLEWNSSFFNWFQTGFVLSR